MRRLGVIVALGAMLGIFAGVLTASPALAGRGHKWQTGPAKPFTLPASFCGFKIRVTTVVNKEYTKILKTADGSKTFLFTPAPTRFHNRPIRPFANTCSSHAPPWRYTQPLLSRPHRGTEQQFQRCLERQRQLSASHA